MSVKSNGGFRTVREILTADFHEQGGVGDPPREFIAQWRAENMEYGRWTLPTRFASGSLIPVRPEDSFTTDPDCAATTPPAELERRARVAEEHRRWCEERGQSSKPATEFTADERAERDAHFFHGQPAPEWME
jgi:hypothetical protein